MKLKRVLFFSFVLGIIYFLGTAWSIYLFSQKDETEKADVAIILGTAVWGDKPSPVFEERIKHGIWLYENGFVSHLLFTGGRAEGKNLAESEVGKIYAVEKGIPESAIFLENQSTITYENFTFSQPILKENNFQKILIVSDPMHMKRAKCMAEDLNIPTLSSSTPTSKYQSFSSKMGFLMRETYLLIGYRIIHLFSN